MWSDRHGRVCQAEAEANDIHCIHDPVQKTRTWPVEDFQKLVTFEPPDPSIYEAFDYMVEQREGSDTLPARTAGRWR